jgi:molybdenum cofactor cytidylyltransferase
LPENSKIAAIVLAAGTSRRFGSNKLLHSITHDGVTNPLIVYALLPWLEVFEKITIVVGNDSEPFCSEIDSVLGRLNSAAIHWVECKNSKSGMSASLAFGVRANINASGWVIGLADMPKVPSAAISGVRDALLKGASLAAPFCNGKRGHPVGFTSTYKEDLLMLQGDTGARHLLERDKVNLVNFEINNSGIFMDVDTLTDLENNKLHLG